MPWTFARGALTLAIALLLTPAAARADDSRLDMVIKRDKLMIGCRTGCSSTQRRC